MQRNGLAGGRGAVEETVDRQHREGSQQHDPHRQGAIAHRFGAHQIPRGGGGYQRNCQRRAAAAGGHPRRQVAQIADEQRGVDGHVEDAARQRQPGFLKSPEASHAARHPDVVAAPSGQRARKLADHECRRDRPDHRRHQQNQNGARVSRLGNDILKPERSARNQEEDGRDQRQQRHLAGSGHSL